VTTPTATDDIARELAALRARLERDRAFDIGFPGAVDLDVTEVLPFFRYLLNNVGDPFVDGAGRAHTKDLEREVIAFFADLFRAPPHDRWGYVTTGGTDGNQYGLHLARSVHPDGLVYYSEAAHYSIPKLVERLRMPAVRIRADPHGEMDYRDLRSALRPHRHRPAIVVASVGTTMTEAVDDVATIDRVLRAMAVRDTFVHADAALAGIPLALIEPDRRPGFDLADGADSIAVSGHKFVGSPFPCGVLLTRRTLRDRVGRPVDYIASVDSTLAGSRSGHAPLLLWHAVRRLGVDGFRARAERSRELAGYAVSRLNAIGWGAWRHPYAFTVVLPTPPATVTDRWTLATSGGVSHIVCMPGVTRVQIDGFVDDVAAHMTAPAPMATVPGRRRLRRWRATVRLSRR
jgi:histidine decarboxylase